MRKSCAAATIGVRPISPSATSIASASPVDFPRVFKALGIGFLVAEMQRVGQRFRHLDLDKNTTIKKRFEPVAGQQLHVVITVGADVLTVVQLAVKQHGAALRALAPEVLWHLAAGKQRVDFGPDVVRNPVHRLVCPCRSVWQMT